MPRRARVLCPFCERTESNCQCDPVLKQERQAIQVRTGRNDLFATMPSSAQIYPASAYTSVYAATASYMTYAPFGTDTRWTNPAYDYARFSEPVMGNGSTWDYDGARDCFRRRSDGMVVDALAVHAAGCRHIIEYEQRFLRPAPVPDLPPCQVCNLESCTCLWTTRDGHQVRVVDMADAHLYNALNVRNRRSGVSSDVRYQPLVREARRRGWYGRVPPLEGVAPDPFSGSDRDPEPVPDPPAPDPPTPYRRGVRVIKIE